MLMATIHSTKPPRILVIGDIAGADNYHVGDEAMVDANLSRIRAHIPDVQFTLVSQDPSYSAELYGAEAIEAIGFAPAGINSDAENFARLEQVVTEAQLRASGEKPTQEEPSITQMVDAVHSADGVLISGGGNLSSTWPQHLFERVALIRIANILNKPIAISGQTIGPNLDGEHALLLAQTLPLVNFIGIRELDSMRLALSLGISPSKLEYQVDDAMHMTPEAPENATDVLKQPYAAVTLHTFAIPQEEDHALAVLADQLERIADHTGLHLLFIPHVGQDNSGTTFSDLRVGQKLLSLLKDPARMTVLGVENARRVIWRTQHAAMVISTRYHPLVFALAGGIPSLAIYTDEYTRIKLQGALEQAHLQRWSIPIKAALSDALFEASTELWQRRDAIIERLKDFQILWRVLDDRYERQLLKALHLPVSGTENSPDLSNGSGKSAVTACDPIGAWRSIVDALIS
jgi:polysaccharide pyruvyl transferase WcaK-like protein